MMSSSLAAAEVSWMVSPSSVVTSSLLGLELAEAGPGEERCLGLLSCG